MSICKIIRYFSRLFIGLASQILMCSVHGSLIVLTHSLDGHCFVTLIL